MKKIISLIAVVLLLLSGCIHTPERQSKYTFYYLQEDYLYAPNSSVFGTERRAIDGTPQRILETYLAGPENNSLYSPFPSGISLESLSLEDGVLSLDLGDQFASLNDIRLTLACTAVAQTCFECFKVDCVQIQAGNAPINGQRQISFSKDSFLLTNTDTTEDAT